MKAKKPHKAFKPKRAKHSFRDVKGKFTKKVVITGEVARDVRGKFAKKPELAPIKYRRPIPPGMIRKSYSIVKKIPYGTVLEFVYGNKQVQGQIGGWKVDRKPNLLVFWDDMPKDRIEGINMNYLSGFYVHKLKLIMKRFPGIDGEEFYHILRRTARFAITKGYRKYVRSSFRNIFTYIYYNVENQNLVEKIQDKKET